MYLLRTESEYDILKVQRSKHKHCKRHNGARMLRPFIKWRNKHHKQTNIQIQERNKHNKETDALKARNKETTHRTKIQEMDTFSSREVEEASSLNGSQNTELGSKWQFFSTDTTCGIGHMWGMLGWAAKTSQLSWLRDGLSAYDAISNCACEPFRKKVESAALESVRRWRHTRPSQTDWCSSIMLCCWLNAGHQSLHACWMPSTYFATKYPLLDLFEWAWSKHWSWLWRSNKNAFTGSWIELCSIINCRSNWISVEAKILQYHMSVS